MDPRSLDSPQDGLGFRYGSNFNKGINWTTSGPTCALETLPDKADSVVHDAMSRRTCQEFYDDWIMVMLEMPTKEMGKYCQKMSIKPTPSFVEFQKRSAHGYNRDGSRKEDPSWPEGSLLNPFNSVNHPMIEKFALENPLVREILSNVDLHRCKNMTQSMIAHCSIEMRLVTEFNIFNFIYLHRNHIRPCFNQKLNYFSVNTPRSNDTPNLTPMVTIHSKGIELGYHTSFFRTLATLALKKVPRLDFQLGTYPVRATTLIQPVLTIAIGVVQVPKPMFCLH